MPGIVLFLITTGKGGFFFPLQISKSQPGGKNEKYFEKSLGGRGGLRF